MSGAYRHVIVVGIDGAGNFYRKANTPAIHRLFEEGAGCDWCLTSIPTISAECWGSMLIGVGPEVHGLTNDIVSSKPYENALHPTVFKIIRREHPNAELGAFCNWSPINAGIVERDLGVEMETGEDAVLTDKICRYIREKKPEFLFVQFDSIDGAGHTYGYGTDKYLAALGEADGYVKKIRDAVGEAGIGEAYDRVIAAFDAYLADHGYERDGLLYRVRRGNDETLVFFCHLGVIGLLLSHLLNCSPMQLWQGLAPAPSSVTTLHSEERRPGAAVFRAASIGDISHLYTAGEEPSFAGRFCTVYGNGQRED